MLKLKLAITISLLLTITSCTTVSSSLPLPNLPSYPKLSQQELNALSECTQCLTALRKLAVKDQLCRGSIKEHRAIIRASQ